MVVLITVHALAASVALLLGAAQLLRRAKGDDAHRLVGRVWVVAMYVVVLTAFGIHSDGFSIFHALAILTFCTLTLGLRAAFRGDIDSHRAHMTGSYLGLLGAFVGAVAVPSRAIPQLVVHDPVAFGGLSALCLAVCWTVTSCADAWKSNPARDERSREGSAAARTK